MVNIIDKDIVKKVRAALEPIVSELELELFDVTFRRESTGRTLRVTIDREAEIPGLEECTEVSRRLSAWLDREDLIPYDGYSLEVSTPGLERPLRNEKDFRKFTGKICKITTKDKDESGRRSYTGEIVSAEDGVLRLFIDKESKEFEIKIDNISKAVMQPGF
jgi:ribosome maturation factor RimP